MLVLFFRSYTICIVIMTLNKHIMAVYLGDTWSQMEFTDDAIAEPVNGYLRPLNRQLMP
jgi:hypothetical protein